jgi:polyisoprenoid-binding protein YceI
MQIEHNLFCVVNEKHTKTTKMKNALLLLTFMFYPVLTNAQVKMNADIEKTTLQWLGEKVMGQHTGTINLKDGWLTWNNNQIVSGEFNIDMASLKESESNKMLEGHLKSDDFFGVEKFPTAKLLLTGSDSFDRGTAVVRGSLTIKGITNPIEFKAFVQKKDEGTWFFANIVIDRTKFNIRYGSGSFFDNLGDKAIYDEFKVKVNLLVK